MDTPQTPSFNSPQEEFNHRRAEHAKDAAHKLQQAAHFYEQAAQAFEAQDERNGELKLRSARQALEPIADELPRPPQPAKPRPVEKPKMDWSWRVAELRASNTHQYLRVSKRRKKRSLTSLMESTERIWRAPEYG